MEGRSVDEYSAPLFIAWQLTNRCSARCITCCEESGPGAAWADELRRDEALDLARRIVESGIPYAAFGGGEPLGVAHCWELFELLTEGGVALKLETDGSRIDDAAADRLAALAVQCVQISVDGATAATHARVRPGSSFTAATSAITRLVARGQSPQLVFVPNRFNVHEIVAAYELAIALGCSAFVTGPMMRIGRAGVDAAAVGLELEGDAPGSEPREDIPAMRDAKGLAAAEGGEGDAEIDDGVGEAKRLVTAQLIAPGLVGTGFLAARKTARAAAVGQLPGKEKGRIVVIDGAPLHRFASGRIQVKRM